MFHASRLIMKIDTGKPGPKATSQTQTPPPEVFVYTSQGCPYCTQAKEYLAWRKIAFTEYDVSTDPARAKEMVEASGQGAVPVLMINGRMVVGFDRQLIDDALRRQKPLRRDVALQNLIFDPFRV